MSTTPNRPDEYDDLRGKPAEGSAPQTGEKLLPGVKCAAIQLATAR
jgi:hypothetical protein